MMISLSLGTRISVCASEPIAYSKEGFALLLFTDIGEVTVVDEFGGVVSIVDFITIAEGNVKKQKGSVNYGSVNFIMGRVTDDGQAILASGMDGANFSSIYSFRISSPNADMPEENLVPPAPIVQQGGAYSRLGLFGTPLGGASTLPVVENQVSGMDVTYFTGMVAAFTTLIGDANTITTLDCIVEIDNQILFIDGSIIEPEIPPTVYGTYSRLGVFGAPRMAI